MVQMAVLPQPAATMAMGHTDVPSSALSHHEPFAANAWCIDSSGKSICELTSPVTPRALACSRAYLGRPSTRPGPRLGRLKHVWAALGRLMQRASTLDSLLILPED